MPAKSLDVVAIGNAIVDVLDPHRRGLPRRATAWSRARCSSSTRTRPTRSTTTWARRSRRRAARPATPRRASRRSAAGSASSAGSATTSSATSSPTTSASIGVDYRVPAATDGPATARCLIFITGDAQRTMNTFLGASEPARRPADVDEAFVAEAEVVYCEGYLWDLPDAKAALTKGMDAAHAAGGQGGLHPVGLVLRRPPPGRVPSTLAEYHIDILFANEAEILLALRGRHVRGGRRPGGRALRDRLPHPQREGLGHHHRGRRAHRGAGRTRPRSSTPPAPATSTPPGFLYGLTHGYSLDRQRPPGVAGRGRGHQPRRPPSRGRPQGPRRLRARPLAPAADSSRTCGA